MTAKRQTDGGVAAATDDLLTVERALARIGDAVEPITGFEQLALRSALDRILAEDICSPLNVPSYANSAMDGYAVRCADISAAAPVTLQIIGTALAGHPFAAGVGAGQAVRIMTGAKLPAGADTVIMQEDAARQGDSIVVAAGHRPGQHVRLPGEDMALGQVVLSRGQRINPAELGLLASLGIAEVKVTRRLRVAFFSTGDELRSLGEPLGDGQLYDSNRYTLHGMLRRLGAEIIDMGVVPDNREALDAAFRHATAMADVLLTSGGVSVGEADYVKETLERLGQVHFWKIAMKPGKPLAFGKLGNTAFFGLPGNPVSAMTTFYQIVQPILLKLMGQTGVRPLRLTLRCVDALKKSPGRTDFQRGFLYRDEQGELVVRSTGPQGSHVLRSMSQANCFIILPADSGMVPAGSMVEVEPFAGLI